MYSKELQEQKNYLYENKNLIHDWRAPALSMFYDFEPGKASFEAQTGIKEGDIVRKCQFRITDGIMEIMVELGEETIPEMEMETLENRVLG